MTLTKAAISIAVCGALLTGAVWAQTPRPARPPKMSLADLVKPLDESGFKPIFNGKTLDGWDGDPNFWRVEDGAIVGQTATDKQPKQNTFLIWRGGSPADFELKMDYKLTGFNSGIQYRSIELPDIKYAMKGYQADMDGEQQWTGQLYEERGRGFVALRGQMTYVPDGGKPGLIGTTGDHGELKKFIHADDWNQLHIIARGNTLVHILNGHVMTVVVDDDSANRKMDGLIGIQCHLGPPMKIEVKNIRLKTF
jgi:hypothetical protein